MRHSFLPEKEQSTLRRGYLVRIAIAMLFLLSLAGLIGVGSLFPAYIYGYTEEKSQDKVAATLKENQNVDTVTKLRNELLVDATRMQKLSVNSALVPTDIIEQIISSRGQVPFDSIFIDDVGTTTLTVTVNGVAPTRESLVSLRNRLQVFAVGNKIDLPISGLAKNKDIPFTFKFVHAIK